MNGTKGSVHLYPTQCRVVGVRFKLYKKLKHIYNCCGRLGGDELDLFKSKCMYMRVVSFDSQRKFHGGHDKKRRKVIWTIVL